MRAGRAACLLLLIAHASALRAESRAEQRALSLALDRYTLSLWA